MPSSWSFWSFPPFAATCPFSAFPSLCYLLRFNMSPVDVTAVVLAIVSAFASGVDIFKRMKAKQRSKKSRNKAPARLAEEEWQLHISLQDRPREIKAEYDRNVSRLGNRFAVGDSTAQTSLNRTLLILNTGLIQILSHALSSDSKAQALSRRSLLNLSENAAADAVRALEQLESRLSSASQLMLTAPPSTNKKPRKGGFEHSKGAAGPPKARAAHKPRSKSFPTTGRKRPGPDPLLRGAWVRSKSGTSVVSGTGTPRVIDLKAVSTSLLPDGLSLPRLPHSRAKSSPSHPSRFNNERPPDHHGQESFSYLNHLPPSYAASSEQKQQHYPKRQPSLLLVSCEVFTDSQTMSPPSTPSAPPRPPKIPLQDATSLQDAAVSAPPLRFRPPSVATFMTASTKIGEIREHRRLNHHSNNDSDPARPNFHWEEQQYANKPLPYPIPPSLEDEPTPKRKGLGLKFWKKGYVEARWGRLTYLRQNIYLDSFTAIFLQSAISVFERRPSSRQRPLLTHRVYATAAGNPLS